MVHSMTAFSQVELKHDLGTIVWELRSVNHRFLDVNFRLPEQFRSLEGSYRALVKESLSRGKVDGYLRLEIKATEVAELNVNEALVGQLLQAYKRVASMAHVSLEDVPVMDILHWPQVLEQTTIDLGPLQQATLDGLEQALCQLNDARSREGKVLSETIIARIEQIRSKLAQLLPKLPELTQAYEQKIRQRAEELKIELEANRVEQELVLLAQKWDVSEELDRIKIHLEEVQRVLQTTEVKGRRLDFLMQELNREANTLTSKVVDVKVTKIAVDIKVLTEQMREQIQNIE